MYRLGRVLVFKLGHDVEGFTFRWVFHISPFSTKPSNIMPDYLVSSLGFSQEEAIVASSKVRAFKSHEKPSSIVHFFHQSGLKTPQIKNLIADNPKILSCNLDKVIKPRMKIFQDLGLDGSDLYTAIRANRQIWRRSLNCQLIPVFEYLKTIFSEAIVSRALMKSPFLIHGGAAEMLPANVALLQEYGFSHDKIAGLLLEKPQLIILQPKRLHDVLVTVETKLKIPRNSPSFYGGLLALMSMSHNTTESKINVYRSFGFSEEDVWALARKLPAILRLSETKIRDGFEFYTKVLGFDYGDIVKRPILLCISLEKSVIPRWTFVKGLQEKGLLVSDRSLVFLISQSKKRFAKFMLEFKDKAPDLCEDYLRSTGCQLVTESQNAKKKTAS